MTARDQIKREEGCRLTPYRDSEGLWTIGYGHCLERRPIPQAIADALFECVYRDIENEMLQELPWARDLSEPRYAVLMGMAYQMGVLGLFRFRKMLAALQARDYNLASIEMLDSEWAGQTGPRARRMATQMREGRWIEREAAC